MPALPLVSQVLRTKLLWTDQTDADVSSNLFWRYSGGAPDAADAQALASDLSTLVASAAGNWDVETTFRGVQVIDLSTNSGGEGTHVASVLGTDTGNVLAGGTCTLVNFQVNRRYRGGKPRIYLPWGTSEKLASKQQWASSYLTSVQTEITGWVSGFVGSTSGSTAITGHVNVSYYEGFTTFTTPSGRMKNLSKLRTTPVVDAIVSSSVNPIPSSQRRRNRS